MAVILDATPGSASANSYTTVADADVYHESHLYAADWTAATEAIKINALITATRLLDEHATWMGWQSNALQALGWPRAGAIARSGYAIQSGVIPVAVKWATAEYARLLITAGGLPNSGGEIPLGLKALKAGPVALEFDPMLTNPEEDVIPSAIWSMIGFLMGSSMPGRTNTPLVRM